MRRAARYGPWALITGASDGIGKALATRIAAEGINVVLCARRKSELETLAVKLTADHGIESMVLPADLADAQDAARVADITSRLDIGLVVLAAGFGTTGSVLETSLSEEIQLVSVNITAVMRLSHTFARRLATRGRGGLVLFGSIVGWQGVPGQANYAASKAYVQSLAEGLHDELASHGVDVLAVAPGPVASGFGARAGLYMDSATKPDVIAKATLGALGRRKIIPGNKGKLLTASLLLLPRRIRSLVLGRVIAGMRASSTTTRARHSTPGRAVRGTDTRARERSGG
ncbi:MAG: SDR family NAD(P)-dependent oxidoreductase [Mycolicibacterium sp.]|uniref:SDR family NAD(P)-dependent oxidoreductase n=1 Tax=Mycolicibacterium sp. TaxID=2320850 RepID=UPI003D0AF44A